MFWWISIYLSSDSSAGNAWKAWKPGARTPHRLLVNLSEASGWTQMDLGRPGRTWMGRGRLTSDVSDAARSVGSNRSRQRQLRDRLHSKGPPDKYTLQTSLNDCARSRESMWISGKGGLAKENPRQAWKYRIELICYNFHQATGGSGDVYSPDLGRLCSIHFVFEIL